MCVIECFWNNLEGLSLLFACDDWKSDQFVPGHITHSNASSPRICVNIFNVLIQNSSVFWYYLLIVIYYSYPEDGSVFYCDNCDNGFWLSVGGFF